MPDVLDRVVNESYRPIFRGLKKIPGAKIVLNINASLTEQLYERGYRDVVEEIKDLVKRNQIELTESAKYHAFLPLIPKFEVVRQIRLNNATNRKYFGDLYNPLGLFSPEMSYSPKIAEVAQELGYKYILADEIAYNGKIDSVSFNKTYKIRGFDLNVYFREKRTSNLIMGAIVRDAKALTKAFLKRGDDSRYLLTAMDGETFGHHRVGLDRVLLDLLDSMKNKTVFIKELEGIFSRVEEVWPKDSTWASSEKDIAEGNPFNLWFDKKNEIHKKQWEFTELAIRLVNDSKYSKDVSPAFSRKKWLKARRFLDAGLHSCQYWWASANPWWSIEMIEEGAFNLLQSVLNVPDAPREDKEKAQHYYNEIVFTANSWQRTGYVREKTGEAYAWKKIPFKKRAKPGEYKALMQLLKEEERRAAKNREYEQAIRWRDAQIKLEKNLDVYDAVHVIDQLRAFIDFKRYNKLVEEYKERYKHINSGQPES